MITSHDTLAAVHLLQANLQTVWSTLRRDPQGSGPLDTREFRLYTTANHAAIWLYDQLPYLRAQEAQHEAQQAAAYVNVSRGVRVVARG